MCVYVCVHDIALYVLINDIMVLVRNINSIILL